MAKTQWKTVSINRFTVQMKLTKQKLKTTHTTEFLTTLIYVWMTLLFYSRICELCQHQFQFVPSKLMHA